MASSPAGSGKGLSVPRNPALALRQLNRQHAATESAPEPENKESDKPSNKPTNLQTNNKTILQTEAGDEEEGAGPEASGDLEIPAVAAPTVATAPGRRSARQTDKPSNKPTNLQTNNKTILQTEAVRRDGRTLRVRQPVAAADASIVTSFRLSARTMEALDEFCFRHRMRKQDVVQQALDAFLAENDTP